MPTPLARAMGNPVVGAMSTDCVSAAERPGSGPTGCTASSAGLDSTSGDSEFDAAASPPYAGDIVLTRLERTATASRARPRWCDKVVGYRRSSRPGWAAPASSRRPQDWVTPDQWSICDTTDSYAVANPVRVEHLIVMPKTGWSNAAPALDALMARRLGGSGAWRASRSRPCAAHRELPACRKPARRRRRRDHAAGAL